MPRRSRWSATVRRCTPYSLARSVSDRPSWYPVAAAAISDWVSRRWTGLVGCRAAPPAAGESTPSVSAASARERGFECCPLLSVRPAPDRFAGRSGALWAFGPAAGLARNPCSEAISRVSGGFESRPQRSIRRQKYNVCPVQGVLRVSDRSGTFVSYFKPLSQEQADQVTPGNYGSGGTEEAGT